MRAVDTNVLVRLIVRDDPDQAVTAEDFIRQGAWVSLLVLAETVWVLVNVYGQSAADVAAAIEMLIDHQHLVLQDADAVVHALDLFRSRPSLGFPDCLILQSAKKSGYLPLGTFDRRFAKIAGTQQL